MFLVNKSGKAIIVFSKTQNGFIYLLKASRHLTRRPNVERETTRSKAKASKQLLSEKDHNCKHLVVSWPRSSHLLKKA